MLQSHNSLVLILSVALDWLFGDPPNAFHPVAWFGRIAQAMEQRAPRDNPRVELLYGAGMTASGIALAALPALMIERVLRACQPSVIASEAKQSPMHRLEIASPRKTRLAMTHTHWLALWLAAVALKMTFAWRGLIRAGEDVQRDLETRATENARDDLRALVSRDTRELDASQLSAAAIESLAENASDAFVAPLFYYHLFGLPGAFAYRAVNTLDSMIGYRGRYEYLGKVAARVDDALNFIPARITAILLVLAARFTRDDARRAFQTMQRDHARTESPNAGYPMSAMAGALDVRLEKVGHYRLNENGRPPQPRDIHRAARIVTVALGLTVVISVIVGALGQIINRKS
ncbi:MAG: cobalamin biosynthesis protein CobD [Chloroflexi bacterium]|nr:cobalamin biosynthesis protein CobD [Chloroflexota bacterium]